MAGSDEKKFILPVFQNYHTKGYSSGDNSTEQLSVLMPLKHLENSEQLLMVAMLLTEHSAQPLDFSFM